MKILWIDLNCSYAHASLALPALHAQLLQDTSIEWEIISGTINENIGMMVEKAYTHRPDIIAATAWLFNIEVLMHITSRLKALLPQSTLILGGPEFLGDNEEFLRKHPHVDCVFRGEGERAFPQWLACYNQPDEWHKIPGLCYLEHNEKQNESFPSYHDNGQARVADFDQLTAPEESCFFNWSKPFVQIETTRGCFNTCAFCVSGGEKPVRTIPITEIRRRLQLVHDKGIKNVRILDRTFNYQPARAIQILNLFKEFADDMHFHLEIHPALLSDSLKEELKRMPAGLLHLEAGIQSLRQPVLDACLRKGRLQDALEGLKFLCSQPNLTTHADLIAGLPLYHLDEIFEDIQTLASFNAAEIQLESLKLLPGTHMRLHATELGIRYSPLPPYEVLETEQISCTELQTARLLSRLLDAYYNTPAWQAVTRRLILQVPGFLRHFLNYLTEANLIDQPMSLEKRGITLYQYCKLYQLAYLGQAAEAWIEAGMSLKKSPAERVKTGKSLPTQRWQKIIYGQYNDRLRLCFLPKNEQKENAGIWFGFETDTQNIYPVFKAISL